MNLFKQAIDRYQMIKIGNPIIAGVSGGADSMALLHFLYQMYKSNEIKLLVAHVHHGLRGKEADRDEAFVRDYCARRNIPFRARHADVAALAAERGQTVEECGREVRYAFFEELRLEQERPQDARIATAHTLSDSIETVLFHMARGTSLKGLRGIPPVRGPVIRPLILSTRADIEAYCAQNGVDYVTDSTNLCADYTRNRIRQQLVPQFYGINARFDEAFSRMVYTLSQDEDCLQQLAEQAICDSRAEAGLLADKLAALPPALLSRAVIGFLSENRVALDYRRINEACGMVRAGAGQLEVDAGRYLCVRNGVLFLQGREEPYPYFCFPLAEGCVNIHNKLRVRVTKIDGDAWRRIKKFKKFLLKFCIDCDKLVGHACIRQRVPGDRLSPYGRGCGKSLKKLCNESRMPLSARSLLPVVCDGQGVVLAGPFGCDERAAADEDSVNILLVQMEDME